MASEFDAVRKRIKRGQEARERVLSGMYNRPKEPEISRFDAVRNRPITAPERTTSTPAITPFEQSSFAQAQQAGDLLGHLQRLNQATPTQQAIQPPTTTPAPAPTPAPVSAPVQPRPQVPNIVATPIEQSPFMRAQQAGQTLEYLRRLNQSTTRPGAQSKPEQIRSERAQAAEWFEQNPVLRGIRDVALEPFANVMDALRFSNPVSRFGDRAIQALQESTTGERMYEPVSTGSAAADKAADVLGALGSVFLNPANPAQGPVAVYNALRNITAARPVANALNRIQNPTARRVAEESLREAVTGAAYAVPESLIRGQSDLASIAENAAINAAAGAVAGAAFPLLGQGVRRILEKYRPQPPQPAQPVLALPEGRRDVRMRQAQQRSVLEPGTTPIVNEYTFQLPEGSPQTRLRAQNIREARNDLAEIESELKRLNDAYQQAINEHYQYLKESMKTRGGVRKGFLIRDQHGDVVDRVGRISENPRWYREFFAQYGRPPSNRELYELAKQHIDEGYTDDLFQMPSWRAENAYDETIEALTQVRDTLRGTLREMGEPITVTDTPLVSNEPRILQRQTDTAPRTAESSPATPKEETIRPAPEPVPEADPVLQEVAETISQPRVRDRVYTFLDEAERKARERIAAHRNRLSSTPFDIYADYAIIGAAKMGKGIIRFADWTEEMVKEFGEEFRPIAQRVYIMAKEELRKQTRLASKEAQRAAEFNAGGGDAETFAKKINRGGKSKKKTFAERWERIRAQVIDDLAALERLERKVLGRLAGADDSLYKSARLFRGVPMKAHQIVQERLEPIVKMVERSGFSMDDLGMYALARHAKDVNEAGYISGFTNAEIDDVLRRLGTEQMEQARKALIQINDDMLQELVDSGVISSQLAETLRVRWPNYVPLFRAFDDDKVEFVGGLSQALANVTAPIKELKGSERSVIDPLENMVRNIFQSVNAAERNRVAQQLSKLAEVDSEQRFIRQLEPNEKVGRKNVVKVKVDGEDVRYEVDPEVYKAMLNLDRESTDIITNILSKPASLLRAGATLTPEFSLRNPIRDILQAYITSNSGFNPLIDFPVGLIQSITKGRLYRDWVNNLGAYGNVLSMDRKVHQEALRRVLKEKPSQKFVNIVTGRSLIRLLRAISDTTESATKIGEYRAALRRGATPKEAAYRSRDIMDFARAGSSVRNVNKIVAFLNANIQGKSKLLRSIKENPVGTTVRALVAVTIPTIGIYAFNHRYANSKQQETLREAPDWMKDTFWLVAIPGTDTVARIPKPFDVAPLFSNLPERALAFVRDNDPEAFEGFVRRSLSDAALPVQISGLLPIVEGMANYSFFREGPIIPMREQNLEFRDQYDPVRTSETARMLAAVAEKLTGGKGSFKNFSSPRVMENTIYGFTAGLGRYATDAIDAILKGSGAVDRPAAPQKRAEQLPLVRSFTVDPLQNTRSLDKLYERREELTRQKNSANANDREFTKADELKRLDKAAKEISGINKEIRSIERDQYMSASEKRRRIEPLLRQRNEIAKQAVR